jgi:hypothetical protein
MSEKIKAKKKIIYSWVSLAEEYDMDYRTLKRNCRSIMTQLNDIVGRSNYRGLVPEQVAIIRKQIG